MKLFGAGAKAANTDLRLRGADKNIFSSTTLVQAQHFLIIKYLCIFFDFWSQRTLCCLYITYFYIYLHHPPWRPVCWRCATAAGRWGTAVGWTRRCRRRSAGRRSVILRNRRARTFKETVSWDRFQKFWQKKLTELGLQHTGWSHNVLYRQQCKKTF